MRTKTWRPIQRPEKQHDTAYTVQAEGYSGQVTIMTTESSDTMM